MIKREHLFKLLFIASNYFEKMTPTSLQDRPIYPIFQLDIEAQYKNVILNNEIISSFIFHNLIKYMEKI